MGYVPYMRLRLTGSFALIVQGLGVVVLLGWALDAPALTSLVTEWVSMKPNSAAAFILSGTALWLTRHPVEKTADKTAARRIAGLAATAILALAALTLGQYLFYLDLGIDRLLFPQMTASEGIALPGRMSPDAAICFLVAGVALLLLNRPGPKPLLLIQCAAAFLITVGTIALTGFMVDVSGGYQWWDFNGMATLSAFGFVILGTGLMVAARQQEGLAWAIGPRLTAAFVAGLLLVLTLIGMTYSTTGNLQETASRVAHTHEVRFHTSQLLSAVQDVEQGHRSYLLTGHADFLEPYASGLETIPAELAALGQLFLNDAAQLRRVQSLERLMLAKTGFAERTMEVRRQQGVEAAVAIIASGQGHDAMERVRHQLSLIENHQAGLAERYQQDSDAASAMAFQVLPITGILSLTILSMVLLLLNREVSMRRQTQHALQASMREAKHLTAETERLNSGLEQRVRERTAQLETTNRELESFSYSISHDLRAPLRHIQGYIGLLNGAAADNLSDQSRHYLATINTASAEMDQLINGLLAFSRISRQEIHECTLPLDDVVRDTIQRLDLASRNRNIVWKIHPLPRVVGDPSLLKLVFTNLVDNALKYTRGRDPAVIEIGCSLEQDWQCIVFVKDNGAGFDMGYAHKLFAVFQRLHRNDEFEGTGIGLATVQRIVNRQGGRIWAQSSVNQGATFSFTLKPARD